MSKKALLGPQKTPKFRIVWLEFHLKWVLNCKAAGHLYKNGCFQNVMNSTATSGASAQKLGNDLWHELQSTETKICSQNCLKRKALSNTVWWARVDIDLQLSSISAFSWT